MSRQIEIIAHRGASWDAPENTLAAVRRGWAEGADAVEIDCRLTRDGHVVVIHDSTTRRTSGQSWTVAERTLDELKSLDVGRWKGPRWADEQIPALHEVLETIPYGRRLFIELKTGAAIVPRLCRVLAESGVPLGSLVVIARDVDSLVKVKRRLPEVSVYLVADFRERKTGVAKPAVAELIATAHEAHLDGLDLKADGPFDAAAAKLLAEDELTFHVWTVDCAEDARRLIELGADGIATNRPGWLREQLTAPAVFPGTDPSSACNSACDPSQVSD
jgi:glycerophosphoryl diester phosphodiesterase